MLIFCAAYTVSTPISVGIWSTSTTTGIKINTKDGCRWHCLKGLTASATYWLRLWYKMASCICQRTQKNGNNNLLRQLQFFRKGQKSAQSAPQSFIWKSWAGLHPLLTVLIRKPEIGHFQNMQHYSLLRAKTLGFGRSFNKPITCCPIVSHFWMRMQPTECIVQIQEASCIFAQLWLMPWANISLATAHWNSNKSKLSLQAVAVGRGTGRHWLGHIHGGEISMQSE